MFLVHYTLLEHNEIYIMKLLVLPPFPTPGLEPGCPAWKADMLTTYIMSDIGFLVHHHSGLITLDPSPRTPIMLLLGLEPRLTESKPDVITTYTKRAWWFFQCTTLCRQGNARSAIGKPPPLLPSRLSSWYLVWGLIPRPCARYRTLYHWANQVG